MSSRKPLPSAAEQLARLFLHSGYVRRLNPERRRTEGQNYKKGDEVRLVVDSASELAVVRRLLREINFKPGRPFVKGHKYAQPLYGRQVVAQFLAMVAAQQGAPADVSAGAPRRQRRV